MDLEYPAQIYLKIDKEHITVARKFANNNKKMRV